MFVIKVKIFEFITTVKNDVILALAAGILLILDCLIVLLVFQKF